MGGNLAQPSGRFKVCIDDVHLDDPDYVAPRAKAAAQITKVRVNQVGYFPSLVKRAIVANPSPTPLHWEAWARAAPPWPRARPSSTGLTRPPARRCTSPT